MKQKFKTKIALSFLAFLLIGLGAFLVPVSNSTTNAADIDCISGTKNPIRITKTELYVDETFRLFNTLGTPPACQNILSRLKFRATFQVPPAIYSKSKDFPAVAIIAQPNNAFAGIQGGLETTLSTIGYDANRADGESLKLILTVFQDSTSSVVGTIDIQTRQGSIANGDPAHSETDSDVPAVPSGGDVPPPTNGDGVSWKLDDIVVSIELAAKEYRIIPSEAVNLRYTLKWVGNASHATPPKANIDTLDESGPGDGTITGFYPAINERSIGTYSCQNGDSGCESANILNDTRDSVRSATLPADGSFTIPYDPHVKKYQPANWPSAQPPSQIWTVDFVAFPVLGLSHTVLSYDIALSKGSIPFFTIKVFATDEERKQSFITDGITQDPRYPQEVGGPVSGDGGNTGTGGGPGPVEAAVDFLLDLLTSIFSTVIAIVSSLVAFVVLSLVVPLIEALIGVQTYKDSFVAVILPGWIVLRNLSNIFFILVLLVIGLATIFRVQGYQYKQLLVNLIIAAVLVNFSLVIGQSILGLADTVQTQLLPPPKTDGTFEFTPVRRLAYVLIAGPSLNNLSKSYANIIKPGTAGEGAGNLFLPFVSLAMALGTGVLFVAIAAMLFIRIIALWILLMLSPLAYVAGVLPNTKSFQKMWWDKFLKYAFYAVILAFFLNIAAFISSNGSTEVDLSLTESIMADLVSGGSNPGFIKQYENISDFVFTIGSNLLVMVFLIIGMKATSSLSLIGSKAIGDFAETGFRSPLWVAKKGGEIANTYKGKKTAEYLAVDPDSRKRRTISALFNPISSGKAVLDNWTNAKKQDQEKIRAAATDVASRLPFTRGDETYKLAELMQQSVDKQQEEATKEDVARNIARVKELSEKKNLNQEDRTKLQATIKVIAEQGGMKELAQALKFAATDEGMRGFMQGMVNNGQLDSYSTGVLGKKLDEIGGKSGEQWIRGAFRYDESKRLAHIGDNVGPAGGTSLFDSAKTAADAEADAERLRDPNVSEAKLESIRKEKLAEEYKKLKTPEEREQWRNGEAAFLMSKNQAKAVAKMSPKALAEDTPSSTFVATTASGDVEANDRLVELALTADARKAEMENTHIRADQQEAIGDALRDETKRNDFINRMQKKLVKEYRKKGKNFTEADVKDEAERNFRAFAGSYAKVNFSGNSYSKIPEKLKDPVASVLAKDDKYEQFGIAYDGLEGKVRGKVQNKANRVLSKISHFNDTELADAFSGVADTKARDAMLASAKMFVHNSFADRLNTRDAGIPAISKAEEEDLRKDIIESVNTIRSLHAGEDLKDPAKRALLKGDLETLLGGKFATRTISGAPINTTTIDNMVNQVIAGL